MKGGSSTDVIQEAKCMGEVAGGAFSTPHLDRHRIRGRAATAEKHFFVQNFTLSLNEMNCHLPWNHVKNAKKR
jgi:hypothetical protein